MMSVNERAVDIGGIVMYNCTVTLILVFLFYRKSCSAQLSDELGEFHYYMCSGRKKLFMS